MHFIDEAKIFTKAGDGGAGCVSFRREKFVEYGGPDGGNGGRGASIILEAVPGLNTLIDFRYKQHFKAPKGEHGKGKNRHGAAPDDIIIPVPVGTQVFDEEDETLIIDMTEVGQRLVLVKGGDGGMGNTHYKSSINQSPRRATPGYPGEERWVWLKLKLLSDAGLLGLPNAGKSTFLGAVSRAKPKIADYPFTTLKPQLGVVYIDDKEFVMADIPGLIEGAHQGIGLGDRFLKHVERCGVLLHLVDGTQDNVGESYTTIRNELAAYSEELAEKQEILALNKCDAMSDDDIAQKKQELAEVSGQKVYVISGATNQGITDVLRLLYKEIREFRKILEQEEQPKGPVKAEAYDPTIKNA